MADPARADEVMVTQNAAAAMGLRLGSARTGGDHDGCADRATHHTRGGRHRPAQPGDRAGPDRQVPHLHRRNARPHELGGVRQPRLSGRAAAGRRGRRSRGGAAMEFDGAVLHRLSGHLADRGGGSAVDTARGARPGCLRRHRRPGCIAPRDAAHRPTAGRPRARPGRRCAPSAPIRPRRRWTGSSASSYPSWSDPWSPWASPWPCRRSSRSVRSAPSTPILASMRTGRCSGSGSPPCSGF